MCSSDLVSASSRSRRRATIFLIGHVTKDGGLAGPKVLEHLVDAIFALEGERSGELRFLRVLKNRFGASDEVGVFKMNELGMSEVVNPSEYFLQESQTGVPGSGVVCILEGTRALILSDEAAMLTGSIGMLPSASLNDKKQGLYEPSHGSAPDIAGQGIANPLATILSAAMMLRFSLNQPEAAARIEAAVQSVLAQGLRTPDIASEGTRKVGTREMGDAVVAALV